MQETLTHCICEKSTLSKHLHATEQHCDELKNSVFETIINPRPDSLLQGHSVFALRLNEVNCATALRIQHTTCLSVNSTNSWLQSTESEANSVYLRGTAFPTAQCSRLSLFTHETDLITQKDDGEFPNVAALVHCFETGSEARTGSDGYMLFVDSICLDERIC